MWSARSQSTVDRVNQRASAVERGPLSREKTRHLSKGASGFGEWSRDAFSRRPNDGSLRVLCENTRFVETAFKIVRLDATERERERADAGTLRERRGLAKRDSFQILGACLSSDFCCIRPPKVIQSHHARVLCDLRTPSNVPRSETRNETERAQPARRTQSLGSRRRRFPQVSDRSDLRIGEVSRSLRSVARSFQNTLALSRFDTDPAPREPFAGKFQLSLSRRRALKRGTLSNAP